MKQWRLDHKVHCVVMMPAIDFLYLTTGQHHEHGFKIPEDIDPNNPWEKHIHQENLEDVIETTENLNIYNKWAVEYQMPPIFLDLKPEENQMSYIFRHEGRHRVAAMWLNGEEFVEVSLRIRNFDETLTRNKTILDLPIYWKHEWESDGFVFEAYQINHVIETNIQNNPIIPNTSLSQLELWKILDKKYQEF